MKNTEENDRAAEWFDIPLYRALSEKILLLGVPKPVIALNACVAFLFVVNFGFFYIIILSLIVHFGCIYAAKSDDQFFDALKAYINKKNYYCT